MIVTDRHKKEAEAFYKEALTLLNESGTNYMLGGGFAMFHYTGIYRDTKDLDVFCKSSEYPKIMQHFADHGYKTELTDVRWLAKVFKGDHFMDIIFDTVNNICKVDDSWYEHSTTGVLFDVPIRYIPAEELLWCKIYVQNREHFDGADVNHILLRYGKKLNWKRVMDRLDQHWHLLLSQFLIFQFIYPADYHAIIPKDLFDELMRRAHQQYDLPAAVEKVCRGPIIDQTQYAIDIKDWDYKVTTIKTV